MARIVSLRPNVETVKLSDEPGAREYEVDFGKESMKRIVEAMRPMQDPSKNQDIDVIREFIVTMGGRGMYDDALALVDNGGKGEEDCAIALSPLVVALLEMATDRLSFLRGEAVRRYMRERRDEAADLV